MSDFKKYAKRADEKVKAIFKRYKDAEQELQDAEIDCKNHPLRYGFPAYESDMELARAQRASARKKEAESRLKQIQQEFEATKREIATIRQELVNSLTEYYSAKPSELDDKAITLLKSGILAPDEYRRMIAEARQHDNYTLVRLCGMYAEQNAKQRAEEYGYEDEIVLQLRSVKSDAESIDPVSSKVYEYDVISEAFNRTCENTAMIPDWQTLTEGVIENF